MWSCMSVQQRRVLRNYDLLMSSGFCLCNASPPVYASRFACVLSMCKSPTETHHNPFFESLLFRFLRESPLLLLLSSDFYSKILGGKHSVKKNVYISCSEDVRQKEKQRGSELEKGTAFS
ncbi:Hypothetical protein, putative [Bodo saltans]|uniref:Uncharacterized protein n=1 Tax=Bodo saltans TaxID=75058 RepID=A0A0S4IMI4_BODSA|nr:Hypothetical protein, putative [Bodo saltans]|eukprot:CUF46606.1 Hypothetical protein, putative [Bodo saltans]